MEKEQSKGPEPKSTLLIGGGIVGLASAYALAREGGQVTVIDQGPIERRASSATAGIIGGSSVIPWASSRLWPRVPGHLLNRDGPLRVLYPWPRNLAGYVARSVLSGRSIPRRRSSAGLANLGLRGWDAWQSLLEGLPEARQMFEQNGCLFFYATPEQRRADAAGNALRRSFGMDLSDLDAGEMKAILPPLACDVAGGVRVNAAGHVLDPIGLQQCLRAAVEALGGRFIPQSVAGFETVGQRVTSITTDDGASHAADAIVLCAGAGSRALAAQLGHKVQMIPAWGASVTFTNPSVQMTAPLLLQSDGIAVTPSKSGLRVSGLIQLGGGGKADAMIATLTRKVRHLFGAFSYTDMLSFTGARPLTADSLPCLGPDPRFQNVFHNFGHGHWGLTQVSISALVISDLVRDRAPRIDISAYGPDRF